LSIGPVDLAIVFVYLLAVVVFGLRVGRGSQNQEDYLLGGRSLPWWAVLGSIVATETSTATFLSVPGLAFAREGGDMRFLQLAFGYVLGRLVVVVLILPQYFRGELFTAYQVLDRRFGGATKSTASVLFLVTRNLADGLRLCVRSCGTTACSWSCTWRGRRWRWG
jgi:Na+/proline symporter